MVLSINSSGPKRIVKRIDGRDIVFDRDGYLLDPLMWSEAVALFLAREAGLETLSEAHWRVLRFVRSYYLEEGKEPINHRIKLGTGMSIQEIQALFPDGMARGVKRLAGLPKPKGCGG
ncbi:sulfurtransferase TusE [Desulfosarcina ovata subsp. sediminis]|uniref:Sulfurtransferase TusE n=1 Tax=Desulfosarcina ovata subsp. sediminis TaxID=885957 RepID=A0A5K7ZF85_9BACT|nr:TusE/DsrC/DsvC family sulfur relay protein [Desulfosarcina ovata]BBO80732.1 sulfurtransferase TusE [Desulfosarcina ovata subsp. sediminis]